MDATLYDIEIYVKEENESVYNEILEKCSVDTLYVEKYGCTDTNINESGKYFTDLSGNNLTNNYVVRGKLTIQKINKANPHLHFCFASGYSYRFILWDSDGDGNFGGCCTENGKYTNDKAAGVKLYYLEDGSTLDWAVVVNEGKAYWFINGELVRQFDSPKLEMLNIGALQMNVLFYNIEIAVKEENAANYSNIVSEYIK